MTIHKSSKKYYYFFRYGFLIIGGIILLFWGYLILSKTIIQIDGENEIAKIKNTWILPIISGFLGLIHLLVSNKASYVEIESENITIYLSGKTINTKMENVEFIKQIPNVKPPLYKMKMHDDKKIYLFVINSLYVEFSGFVKDYSSMSKYFKEKTK